MQYAPIVLFVYRRLGHLKLTINSLKKNKESKKSNLIIFSDGSKNKYDYNSVIKVRKYINNINGFKNLKIIFRKKNFGLANNLFKGINQVFKRNDKAIVLEDDIMVSPTFLKYMNLNLKKYEKNLNVASIHGYCYPVKFKNGPENFFFLKGADCWGWATWRRAWKKYDNNANNLIKIINNKKNQRDFDFNFSYPYFDMLKLTSKKNHSWAIKWYASAFVNDMFTLYPKKSFVTNTGNDGSGTNSLFQKMYNTKNLNKTTKFDKIKVEDNVEARFLFEKFFNKIYQKKNLFEKLIGLYKK
tara:strand:+ start:1373 stop:2269 length:897 start_codon:yes stop_codon:yes gene_type:complete